KTLARFEDVRFGDRRMVRATLGEQIAAQQRVRRSLEQDTALLGVRHVRRVEPLNFPAAEGDHLAVLHRARLAVGDVVDRDHCSDLAAERYGSGSDGKQFVDRAAFICLEMRKADVAEPLGRHYVADSLAHQWKELSRPGMK